jgi:hypothetical protein
MVTDHDRIIVYVIIFMKRSTIFCPKIPASVQKQKVQTIVNTEVKTHDKSGTCCYHLVTGLMTVTDYNMIATCSRIVKN